MGTSGQDSTIERSSMGKSGTEKSLFSKVDQVGVLVRDLDKAVEYYEALGIGPFHPPKKAIPINRKVYGKPAPDVKNRGIMAEIGEIEFELVQPVSGESIQRKFLETRGEGINHLGFFVNDVEKETARLIEKGFKVISSWRYAGGGGGAYFNTDRVGGVIFELLTGH